MSILPDEKPVPIPRENPFRAMAKMMRNSLGSLPAHLVVIFVLSLTLTVLCGIFIRFAEIRNDRNNAYLPERLGPDKGMAALDAGRLSGTWLSEMGDYVVTLELGRDSFEIIARYKGAPISRYFIRGGFRTDGNVLIMQERKDLGTPIDTDHLEYKFYPLGLKNINLYAETNGQVMVWKTPSKERDRLNHPEPIVSMIFGDKTEWVKASDLP